MRRSLAQWLALVFLIGVLTIGLLMIEMGLFGGPLTNRFYTPDCEYQLPDGFELGHYNGNWIVYKPDDMNRRKYDKALHRGTAYTTNPGSMSFEFLSIYVPMKFTDSCRAKAGFKQWQCYEDEKLEEINKWKIEDHAR